MEKNLRRAMLSCAGCTLMLFVTCGLAFNVFSAAQPYVLAQNGFTNTQTSLITTIRSAAYLLGTFAIGRYYRRLGYRTGCALAAMLACVSFLLFAAAKSLAAYYFAEAVGADQRTDIADARGILGRNRERPQQRSACDNKLYQRKFHVCSRFTVRNSGSRAVLRPKSSGACRAWNACRIPARRPLSGRHR